MMALRLLTRLPRRTQRQSGAPPPLDRRATRGRTSLMVLAMLLAAGDALADPGATANNQAWKAVEKERYEDALRLFGEAAELAPSNGNYRRYIGWTLYLKLGRNREALPHLEQARKMIPADISVHLDMAIATGNLKLYDEMFAAYDAALALFRAQDETPPEWIFTICASVALFGLPHPDIGGGKKYLDLDNQWSINGYGALLDKSGDHRGAVEVLERGYLLHPDNPYLPLNLVVAYRSLADGLWKAGEESEADTLLQKALAIQPKDFWTNLDVFYKHYLAGKDDTEFLAERVLGLIDDKVRADHAETVRSFYVNYGSLLSSQQDMEHAREILNRGLTDYPNDPLMYSTLAFTYFRIDMEMWREMSEKTLEMVPRFEQIAQGEEILQTIW